MYIHCSYTSLSTPEFQEGFLSHFRWTTIRRTWGSPLCSSRILSKTLLKSLSGCGLTGPVGNLETYPVHNQIHGLVPIDYDSSSPFYRKVCFIPQLKHSFSITYSTGMGIWATVFNHISLSSIINSSCFKHTHNS